MDRDGQIVCTNMNGINLLCNDSEGLGASHGPEHQSQPHQIMILWLNNVLFFLNIKGKNEDIFLEM